MDNDKILVIDAGRVVEFDSPVELLKRSDGYFKQLVNQSRYTTVESLTMAASEINKVVCN